MAEAQLVRYATDGDVAIITVDNPPVNALSPGVDDGILEGLAKADAEANENSWGSILMGGASGANTGRRQGYGETFTKSLVRTMASSVGRAIAGAIFGRR